MNVEIGTEAAQFPEKEYINGIFVAVWPLLAGAATWRAQTTARQLQGQGCPPGVRACIHIRRDFLR